MARPSGGSFVGLDIGSQTIKVVEARGHGTGLQISALGMENTPPGAIQGGIVADPKALGAAIQALIRKSGVGAKRAVSAATGAASVVVRVIEVPRMTPAELAETMKWEVERHIPFAANDVEMSYQPIDDPALPPDPNNPNMEVLLAVAQRDMVATHIETLQAAGLNPTVIDIEPLAAGRALINLSRNGLATKNVVVVNIGAANTDVGIFKNGILRFPRTLPLAGDNFTRAIADHLGLSMEAAEEEKRENAVIMMDLLSGVGSAGDFAPASETPGPAATGRTPFDFSVDTPAAGASAYDDSATAIGGGGAFDLTDDAAAASPARPAVDLTDTSAADNPFVTPPAPPVDPAPSPFADVSPASAAATAPVPLASDPRAQRRREVFDAILPVLGEFVTELRRSIDYFRSRYPSDTVDQILLCGGSARIPQLDQFIQSDLGVPTVIADPFASVNVASRQVSSERLSDIAPAFAVAVGLATRDALLGGDK